MSSRVAGKSGIEPITLQKRNSWAGESDMVKVTAGEFRVFYLLKGGAIMKRILVVLAIAMALFTVSLALAQDKCTVSGEVVYSGDSKIYVCLYNSTSFAAAASRQKDLPPPGFVQIVEANASGKVSFAFNDAPKGDYVVHAFADENSNAKMDCDTQGAAIEPRDFYKPRPHGLYANWYEQKFTVDKDVTGIVLKLH